MTERIFNIKEKIALNLVEWRDAIYVAEPVSRDKRL